MRSHASSVLVGSLVTSALAVAGLGVVAPAAAATPSAGGTSHGATASALSASGAGAFTAVGPNRILDTRANLGITGHLGTTAKTLQITGKGNVPSGNVSAVVFNLTVVNPTRTSYITVWPTGQSRPTTSNINFVRGFVGANLVTVKVGTGGKVSLVNGGGTVDAVADVVGWYSDAGGSGAGNFQTLDTPTRLWDSRPSSSLPGEHVPMAGLSTLTLPLNIQGGGGSANAHVKSVAVSLTAVNTKSGGYFTAWSGAGAAPTASVLNWTTGGVVPNLAVVPVSPCVCPGPSNGLPSIAIKNGSSSNTDIVIDLWGFYDDGTLDGGLRFKPLGAPIRIVDTRQSIGATTLFTGSTRHVTAPASVADAATALLVQNVTAIPNSNTFLTLYPHGVTRPVVSNLNPRANRIVAGLAYTGVGASNDFDIFNSTGTDNVVIDVAGSMEPVGSFKAGTNQVRVAQPIQASVG
jgi:hypothetical protein